MNELFRFIAAQGAPVDSKGGLIDGGQMIKGSQLAKDLHMASGPDRAGVAMKYMATERFVKGSDASLRALLRIASAFKDRKPISQPAFERATNDAMGQSVARVASDPAFREFEQRLAESLLVCRLARTSVPYELSGQLALALRVTHAIMAIAGGSSLMDDVLARPWTQMVVFGGFDGNAADRFGGGRPGRHSRLVPKRREGDGAPDGDEVTDSEHSIRGYRARLEAGMRAIDDAILELQAESAAFPPRPQQSSPLEERDLTSKDLAEDDGGEDEDKDLEPAYAEERFSEGTRELLRQHGLSLRYIEDFADLEERLSGTRAALRSRLRRLERQSRGKRMNVAGGSLVTMSRDVRPGLVPDFYGADGHLGEPGAPKTVGTAKVVQGLLMRVEDKVLGYEAGAIAKIVNIPAAATKDIETELRTRTEEVTETETGETAMTEQSVQTDERFALQTETENEINLEMSAKAAGGFSAAYGPVSAEGSAEASTTFGMHSATSTASDYAKNVVEKAVSRLVKTKREVSRRTRVVELRDLQKEGFDNTAGDNVTAIYQWVDEVHEGRLLNYDSRLMLEFLIPQPGAVLLWSMTGQAAQKDVPQPPPPFDLSLDDLEPSGIADLVEEYGATDIPVGPPRYRFVSKVVKVAEDLKEQTTTRKQYIVGDESLAIPEGYHAETCWVALLATHKVKDEDWGRYVLRVGKENLWLLLDRRKTAQFSQAQIVPQTGIVPIAITGSETRGATAIVIIRCERSEALLEQWRIEVYAALQKAYQRQMEEYEDKLRMARVRGGLSVQARNPAQNRIIERDEIKRAAISILTAQHYDAFGAIIPRGLLQIPGIRFDEAATEGEYIQFFESAFEWTQIEYVLHSYFWANPAANWLDALKLQMDDPLHEEFLRAGAARVSVPVRLGFEGAVLTYLSHPEAPVLWDGQEYEDIDMDSDFYFPIWRAIMERQGQSETEPIQVGDPWRFRVPTNNQIIRGDGQLPAPP